MPATLSFARFQQSLIRGRVEPVYLFEGEELFFHEEGLRQLGHALATDAAGGLNRDVLQGAEISLAALLDLAATYPMGGGTRLVVVRGADAIRSDDLEELKRYLARPSTTTCLVLSDPKFDRRRALYRVLQAAAVRIDCAPLDETATAGWVRERLRQRGYGLTPDLAEAITAGLSGDGLARLDAELDKLMSAIGAPRPVQPDDLAILSAVPRVSDAFRVAQAIVQGRRGEAVTQMRVLLRAGEDPLRLLGGIAWYFRNALRARVVTERRLPPREATGLYGIDPARVERFRRECGAAPIDGLGRALALCLRADRELKGAGAGVRDPAHALERLIHHAGRGLQGRAS
jgi:DNA polymerase III subunit delta